MKTFIDSFGTIIKTIRKERQMTQKMLSQDICSQSVLSRIENNEELPNVVVMAQICQRLGVTIDQVMSLSNKDIRGSLKQFDLLAYYFRKRDYQKLEQLLKEPEIIDNLFLESDYQRYYYYLGTCEFELYKNLSEAICYLKQALSYSSHIDKIYASDIEIQLISCIGKIYGAAGKTGEARYYLNRSTQLFEQFAEERTTIELTQIFYNHAAFLLEQEEYNEALEQIDQGIRWAQEKNSYYYLDDLFLLKSHVFDQKGDQVKAAFYFELAKSVQMISKNS